MSVRLLAIISNASAIIGLIIQYLPVIQLIAVLIAIASGLGAIHLTILKIRLANKQFKK